MDVLNFPVREDIYISTLKIRKVRYINKEKYNKNIINL